MSKVLQSEHVSSICSLVASIQRSPGLWRLQEVLSRYKWPEYLETDFVFGSSSIGAVNAQFLAAFSAAAGKTSVRFSESEESDPDKTWQRLRNVDVLRDAIPYPSDRVNYPMHVKIARRRFQPKEKDASSFGWVYCGSHNFSAAAWGRPMSNSFGIKSDRPMKMNSVLGSRLHICNYELGIIFIVPPPIATGSPNHKSKSLDDIILPFVVPAPKYRPSDTPATALAMRKALAERERDMFMEEAAAAGELMEEEIPDEEEEVFEATDYVTKEHEDEKAYAEMLWSQVDSSESFHEITADERMSLVGLDEQLKKRVVGQNEAGAAICRAVKRSQFGLKDPNRLIVVMLFCDPTGVG
ncbi:clp ATPase [Actinidia rufa]|uniref:Clp ATPase n=1 Tax=Actinidia rufa TaxID=165716 RepID=A0A7J0H2G6_9ERIC|nr:clp ATPase [Actinidia rufa]